MSLPKVDFKTKSLDAPCIPSSKCHCHISLMLWGWVRVCVFVCVCLGGGGWGLRGFHEKKKTPGLSKQMKVCLCILSFLVMVFEQVVSGCETIWSLRSQFYPRFAL